MSELFKRLQQHGLERGTKTALQRYRRGDFTPTSFAELASGAHSFANAFGSSLSEGQIIPMLLARTPDCVAAMLGALGAGCAFSCVNQKLRPPQIEKVLVETEAPMALIDGPGLMALKTAISPDSPIAKVRWGLLRGDRFGKSHERIAEKLAGVASVEDWDPAGWTDLRDRKLRDVEPSTTGCCLFTSGSTGTPKGVMIGHEDLVARAKAEARWFELEVNDVLLCVLPFSFDVGLNQLLSALHTGCELALLDSWFSKDVMNVVEARKVTGISAVPSIWQDFLTKGQAFDIEGAHASLRYITVSGGDLSQRDLARLPDLAEGVGIFKTYGQTEAFRGSSLRPSEFHDRPYSVGRAFDGAHVYIVRDDGTRASPNETGEVVITGLGVMLGYLDGRDPESKLRPNPFRGPNDDSKMAIFTGDQGHVDDDGYLRLEGRRDDMIKVQGNRVYPGEVCEQLLAVSGVAQAEVVPVKAADDNRLVAFLVGGPDGLPSATRLTMKMGALVPSYMLPTRFVEKPRLPLTANGKPDRPKLVAEAIKIFEREPPISKLETLRHIAEERGTPCFVYFMDEVYARIDSVAEAFDELFEVSYAMKCNPHPAVLRRLQTRVATLDISSGGELATAMSVGWPASTISFTGPAKRQSELQAAIDDRIGEVIVESVNEAESLDRLAADAGITQEVCIRIAPQKVPKGFGVKMSGKPCQFGIDEEVLDEAVARIQALPNLDLVGLHIYSGTQCLKPDAISENYDNFVDIFRRACETHDIAPKKLIFGSGIGIPYHDKDEPVSLAPIAERVAPALRELKSEARFADTQLLLETGRYMIGEAGIYLTRVVNAKHSRGTDIRVLDGGMNHHLGACGHLGMVLHRNYQMLKVSPDKPGAEKQKYDLFGPLCTSIDTLGRGVEFSGLDVGDVIGVRCSGAYGVTASPINFISHDRPRELIVETVDGEAVITDISGEAR